MPFPICQTDGRSPTLRSVTTCRCDTTVDPRPHHQQAQAHITRSMTGRWSTWGSKLNLGELAASVAELEVQILSSPLGGELSGTRPEKYRLTEGSLAPSTSEVTPGTPSTIGPRRLSPRRVALLAPSTPETLMRLATRRAYVPVRERGIMPNGQNPSPYKCGVCGDTFDTMGELASHRQTAHPESDQ